MMRAAIRLATLSVLASAAPVFFVHASERATPSPLRCDSSIAAGFKPNAETKVLLVRAFKKGDAFPNLPADLFYDPSATRVKADLCLVKLRGSWAMNTWMIR